MSTVEIHVNDVPVQCRPGQTVLEACRKAGAELPTLCHMDGLGDVGACRLCLVELEGSPRLFAACTLTVAPNQRVRTDSERLRRHRRTTVELLFSERNHVCSVCVANGDCELQRLGYQVGMDHVRFPFLNPDCAVDASKSEYLIDQNRCVLCTRCVRVCEEVEGAHNWDVRGRGTNARVISDFDQPWAESATCTTCGKCVDVCPVGALWEKHAPQGRTVKRVAFISELINKRGGARP